MKYGIAPIFATALMVSAAALAQDQSTGQTGQQQTQGAGQQQVLSPRFTRFIQMRLHREGMLDKSPTGVWDADTSEAVQNFQEQHNIQPTGQLDGLTILALITRPTGAPGTDTNAAQSGSSNPAAAPRAATPDQPDQGSQRLGGGLNPNVAADAYVAGFTRGLEQGFRQAQLLLSIRQNQRQLQQQQNGDDE